MLNRLARLSVRQPAVRAIPSAHCAEDSQSPLAAAIIAPMEPAFERLTDKQREVLRLFYQNYEVKEIARALNINDHAVTERLRAARRILGLSKSMEAARALAAHEGYIRDVVTPDVVSVPSAPLHSDEPKRSDVPVAVVANRYNLSPIERLGIVLLAAIGFVVLSGSIAMGVYALSYLFKVEHISVAEKPYTK